MQKVLVVGGTGMLGHKLVSTLGSSSTLDVHCTVRVPPTDPFRVPAVSYHTGVDVGSGSSRLRDVLEATSPDVVVNAIGAIKQKDLYSAIDETFYLNANLPHLLALLNPNPGGRVIHFSTDCVFRGDRGGYTEDDVPDVTDLYGRSKACGEMAYGPHLTIRTSIIGFELAGHLGLLSWFFKQPRGSALRGFTRAIYSGLPTVTLSRTVRELIEGEVPLTGLYQVASEPISKYELLRKVNEAFGLEHTIRRDDSLSMDRSLNDSRYRAATGTTRPGWDELVRELVADYQSNPYASVYSSLPD
jgi:dTDP-4-dehydrorhamnose reductase